MRSAAVLALVVGAMLAAAPAHAARPSQPTGSWVREIERLLQPKPNKHIRRANRYLAKCLAPTAPVGEDVHNYDVGQGEFVAWWGQAEYQLGTVQVWWAHWPKKDHNPTLAGVVFSAYGVSLDSDLYAKIDACTSAAVNNDVTRG